MVEAANVLVAVVVPPKIMYEGPVEVEVEALYFPVVVDTMVDPMVLRGYESEGKWMSLFRDMFFLCFL